MIYNPEIMEFDETKCTAFINSRLKELGRATYDPDELLNIVDMIFDYYESRGLLDIDDDSDEEDPQRPALDADVAAYVRTMLKRDKLAAVKPEDVETIVVAELDYEETLE